MQSTKASEYELSVSARTENGKVSVDLGLDDLEPNQRDFIFKSLAITHKGGSAGFGMRTEPNGDIILEVTVKGPNKKTRISKAIKAELH